MWMRDAFKHTKFKWGYVRLFFVSLNERDQKKEICINNPMACDKEFVLFLTEEAYSHGGLQTRELGQTPLCYYMDD